MSIVYDSKVAPQQTKPIYVLTVEDCGQEIILAAYECSDEADAKRDSCMEEETLGRRFRTYSVILTGHAVKR